MRMNQLWVDTQFSYEWFDLLQELLFWLVDVWSCPGAGEVLAEKFGRGVWPASQNPYPIYDQILRFSLPYLWSNQKIDTLFMTWLLDH